MMMHRTWVVGVLALALLLPAGGAWAQGRGGGGRGGGGRGGSGGSRPTTPTPAQPTTPATPTTPTPVKPIQPAADHSLDLAAYTQQGLPDVDKPWGPAEYAAAVKVFTALAQADPTQLPRSHSTKSGKVWVRLTSPENWEAIADTKTAAAAHLTAFNAMLPCHTQIQALYAGAAAKAGGPFDTELVDLQLVGLKALTKGLPLAEAGVATWPDGTPKQVAAQQAVDAMRGTAAQMADAALTSLTDKQNHRKSELSRLARELGQVLPAVEKLLPEAARAPTIAKAQQQSQAEPDADLKASEARLAKAIQALPKTPAAPVAPAPPAAPAKNAA